MIPEPDVVLGDRYALIRRIAVGGMGEVWEATDTLLDRRVAVKILKEEFRSATTFLARFRAEARHAGQLSHPGIATVYDYGETDDVAFLVMELVRGHPLSELMVQQPDMPTMTKLSIISQAAEALHVAHEAGVVHRDVKPGNLMIRDDGVVKVTDFGIARALTSAPLTDTGHMIGTPGYVSPEQAAGGQVTGASDIYSLSVVAYELFAGRPPFERDTPLGLTFAHVNDTPPPLPATVPRGIAELIESGMAKDPLQRPRSAADVAQRARREMAALTSAPTRIMPSHQDHGLAPTTVSPVATPVASTVGRAPSTLLAPVARRRESGRHPYALTIAFAGLLILIGVAVWATTRSTPTDVAASDPSETLSAAPVPTDAAPTSTPAATTVPPTTVPPTTVPPTTVPLVTLPPTTAAPITAPPPAVASAQGVQVGESEAVAFVTDYYERLRAGEYETTWALLSPGFRDARNLTFERYVAYWESTSIELSNLRFAPGPGVDEGRVVFEGRYDTGSGVVDETDEVTLRRDSDGNLIITEQRAV